MSGEKIVNILSEIAKQNIADERKSPEPDKVEIAKTAAFLKDWADGEPIVRRGPDSTFWVCGKRMLKITFKMANALVKAKQAKLKGDPKEAGATLVMKRTIGNKSALKKLNEREKAKAEKAAAREKAKAEKAAARESRSNQKRSAGKMDNRKITVVVKDPGYRGSRQARFDLLKTGMTVDAFVAAAEKAGFVRGKAMSGLRIFEEAGCVKLTAGSAPKKAAATGAARKQSKKTTAKKAPAKTASKKAPARKTKAELKKGGVKGTPFEKMYPGIPLD